ncbi:MAG: helix-turn-helix domain-containing protein [Candidatus Fimadaptatus sp.]
MLNENLSRIRRERGLTQAALANKLNVVRQSVSKWENGTAVPDADMLCRLADALDVSAAELLRGSEREPRMDTAAGAGQRTETDEQQAFSSRMGGNALKAALEAVIGMVLLIALVMALKLSADAPAVDSNAAAQEANAEEAAVGIAVELGEDGMPLLERIDPDEEHALRDFLGSRNISREQMVASWGKPARESDRSASWFIGDDKVMTVFFNESHYAYDCGMESR